MITELSPWHDTLTSPARAPSEQVLVVGNLNDPATRYQDAVSTSWILARGRLLTVAGWGHISPSPTTQTAEVSAHASLMPPTLAQTQRGEPPPRRGMWTVRPVP
jgi:hypothetical protein